MTAHIVTENKDDTLENYFFGLVMAKSVIIEAIDSVLAKVRYLSSERGDRPADIRWLSDEEKLAISRMLLGSEFDGNTDEIKKYINRTFLDNIETLRKHTPEERGVVSILVLTIVENLIDVHDSEAMNFVMHDKKEDVERLLLERLVAAIKELGQALLVVLSAARELFERTSGANHTTELAEMWTRLKKATNEIADKYEYDSEIENNIELFRGDMQRLRGRL